MPERAPQPDPSLGEQPEDQEAAGTATADASSSGEFAREPPAWLPKAAVATIPFTAVSAALFGNAGAEWGVGALFVGTTVFLFLTATWFTLGNLRSLAMAFGLAIFGAAVLTVAMLGATRLADEIAPTSPTTATTTVPSQVSQD